MDECIDRLGNESIFTTMDANKGYWQLVVREHDREKTAFCSYEMLYEFARMPFWMMNAPSSFRRALDKILSRHKWKNFLVYLDDILIFYESMEDPLGNVDSTLSSLQEADISLKIDKCQLFTKTVKYLGHIVRPGTAEVKQAATKAMREENLPKTLTHMKSFLGFLNVYRRFISQYTKKAQML